MSSIPNSVYRLEGQAQAALEPWPVASFQTNRVGEQEPGTLVLWPLVLKDRSTA